MTIERWAQERAAVLLDRLEHEVGRTAAAHDPDAVHDLRVTIRRLKRCLSVFADFYPRRSRKQVRRSLSQLMDLAAAVRDRDITLELMAEAGISRRSAAGRVVTRDRDDAARALLAEVEGMRDRDMVRRWREELAS